MSNPNFTELMNDCPKFGHQEPEKFNGCRICPAYDVCVELYKTKSENQKLKGLWEGVTWELRSEQKRIELLESKLAEVEKLIKLCEDEKTSIIYIYELKKALRIGDKT